MTNYITMYNYLLQKGSEGIEASKRVKQVYSRLAEDAQGNDKYIFDINRATRPIEFIERFCKHSKGEWSGKPVTLDLFQKAFIQALFGFIDKETGLRKYREAFFLVARKNGKSTLLAGITLYMLTSDGEGGAECYTAATKYAQAKLIFDEVHNMIKQSVVLSKHFKKRKNDLYYSPTMSVFKPLSRNADTQDGLNSSFVCIDELHGIKDRNTYEVLKQSQSARRQPLFTMITTAGTIRECIFDDMYQYACDVVDGIIEDSTFLPIIYELDNREEWNNPQAWIKANPALGSIKKLDDLTTKVERAKQSPNELSGLLCKDFNIRETVKRHGYHLTQSTTQKHLTLQNSKGLIVSAALIYPLQRI